MSYYGSNYGKPREPRADHEKIWFRAKAIAWDDRWQALSVPSRRAYLLDIRPPAKEGSTSLQATLADKVEPEVARELADAGFLKLEPGHARKSAKMIPNQAAYDFSARLRAIHRHQLLGTSNREDLVGYFRYAFHNDGGMIIRRVLEGADVADSLPLDEELDLYVATRRWPDWALKSCRSKWAGPLLEAIRKADAPVRLADLAGLVKKARPEEVQAALGELVAHVAVFEDLTPDTFELIVGLLPRVRVDLLESSKPRKRPPLVVCEHPKQVGPIGGLEINDLRVFLLEVAGEAPRLRRDLGIFQRDEDRLLEALPDRPDWVDAIFQGDFEGRLGRAFVLAKTLKLVEFEQDDKTTWLRLSGKGRNWLAAGFEEQYAGVYEWHRSTSKKNSVDHDYSYGDSKFLGIPVTIESPGDGKTTHYSYYNDSHPEQRDALRARLSRALQALPIGVYHRWDSVLDHACFGEQNPLTGSGDLLKLHIRIDRRQVPRLPELVEKAARQLLDAFLRRRLLPFDAVRAGIDAEGKLCIARLPRLDGYFGRPYRPTEGEAPPTTRVIVQPDFSVLVIGLDPGPAAELAPFCERVGGQAGQGVLTFKITRDSVLRAAGQGLTASAIVARLEKHASVAVPENILAEVREWAGWLRLVNVRAINVVRCPDEETVARVVSALGKKAERLGGSLVALHLPKLSTVERQKLQEHGILVTKQDIIFAPKPRATTADVPSAVTPKKRGRPRKVR